MDEDNPGQDLIERVKRLESKVNELEAELSDRAAVRWDSGRNQEIKIESTDDVHPFPLGRSLSSKISESMFDTEIDELHNEIQELKMEGVDTADLIGQTDSDVSLPIEGAIDSLKSDVREDPSANKQRACVVFRAFGARSTNTQGQKLTLRSPEVRNILEDPDKMGMGSVDNNTVRRTMHQCAKLTCPEPKPSDREVNREDNLLKLEHRRDKLTLVADASEWKKYLREVEERYQD